ASSLEDRVLLSGAGHTAHAAEVARPLAETAAGQRVTALFESILNTAPTGQQLAHGVHELRSGAGAKVLRRELSAERARASMRAQAARNVMVSSDPPPSGAARRPGRAIPAAPLPNGLNSVDASAASKGLNVRQVPAGMAISLRFSPRPTPTADTGTTGTP